MDRKQDMSQDLLTETTLLIENNKILELRELLEEYHTIDILDIMENLDEEMEDLNEEMEDLNRRMEEESNKEDQEDGEEAYFFDSEDDHEAEETSTERILLKRVINASYWVDPTTFRKVTLTYPG